jgi:DNA-binding MarR family transcriptional regulator
MDIAEAKSWQHYSESALFFHATQNRRLRAEHRLSVTDLHVLDILNTSFAGAARMGDLAGALELTPTHLTKRIRRLTARELVRREPSPEDRRGVLAVITRDGREVTRHATVTYALGVQTHLIAPLSRPQVIAMEELCRRIGAIAGQTATAAPMDQLPGLDDTEMRCWRRFVDSSQYMLATMNSTLMGAHRLTLVDVLTLYVLATCDKSARMSDLSALLMLAPSRVTQQIGRLEAQGLVQRTQSPDDWRSVVAGITSEGRARVGPALETYAKTIRAHYLDQLSRQQMIALGDSCRRITTSLRTAARPVKAARA